MITQHDIKTYNGSTIRPRWEIEALKNNNFTNIELIDNFDKTKIKKIPDSLIHAHQLSGMLLNSKKYIADIHGLEFIQSMNLSKKYSFLSWKRYGYFYKSLYYKKIESKIFKNALHLICSGEDVYENVSKFQDSTLVRNGVFIEKFFPSKCENLKIALVGPFIPGTINYDGKEIIKKVISKLPNVEFIFIGKTDLNFKKELTFKNTKFLGIVKNYYETLHQCNVLFSPYPDYARYLGSKNKFLEAAASNMPIVTTTSGAIDFPNDLLLIGDSIDELVEKINLLKNENLRIDLGKKLRREIENNYNANIEIKKILKIYKEFLN